VAFTIETISLKEKELDRAKKMKGKLGSCSIAIHILS